MSVEVKDKVADYLGAALGRTVDLSPMPGDTALNTFGLDSLSTIGVLVTLLEDCGVDLGEHVDSLVTPSTLDDLYAIAGRFMIAEDSTPNGSDMSREQRSQL